MSFRQVVFLCSCIVAIVWFVPTPAAADSVNITHLPQKKLSLEQKRRILDGILEGETDAEGIDALGADKDKTLEGMEVRQVALRQGAEIIVINTSVEVFNANFMIRIYEKTRKGYRPLLGLPVLYVEMRGSSTRGYKDLFCTSHNSSVTTNKSLFQYDGKKYQEVKCWQYEWRGGKQVKKAIQCDEK